MDLTESLFVDDRQLNLDGAEAVGMESLLFTGYGQLAKDLKDRYGILIPEEAPEGK